jgi:hypothetical protein
MNLKFTLISVEIGEPTSKPKSKNVHPAPTTPTPVVTNNRFGTGSNLAHHVPDIILKLVKYFSEGNPR